MYFRFFNEWLLRLVHGEWDAPANMFYLFEQPQKRLIIEDQEAIANRVADLLSDKSRAGRDEEFIDKLVDKMVEHRSPCHELDEEQVDSIKDIAKNLDEKTIDSLKDVIRKYRKMENSCS